MKVELLDYHGSDLLVVRAARVSFAKDTDWEYTQGCSDEHFDELLREGWQDVSSDYEERLRKLSDRDAKLINYLAREKHVLPFRHPQITLRCKAPIFLARQLGKHQVGLSWSEESRRYIDSEPEFFWPDKWRKRAENVKQGSSDEEFKGYVYHEWTDRDVPHEFQHGVDQDAYDVTTGVVEHCVNAYNAMLYAGIAPEQARMILPQNMYVNWAWTGSLLSFFEMYKLRSEGHAQKEAQDFAELVKEIVYPLYPVSWQALENNI